MTFKKKIKQLRKAREKDRLVIFVGAGVSKNSGIPTWNELIKCFAEKLKYDNCKKCNFRKSDCPIPDCKDRYNFSQDEYLKIPQYFFNLDTSDKKTNYNTIIKQVLNVKASPNPINELIMDLYPKHIITTNFDKLIENTKRPNSMMYKVITKDEELLTYQDNNNYIIKMHGDIDNLDAIVLKESDYLKYHQDHILIETFIKSLLIDHTFLFIGYSLNDYNLKLIISWIENLAKGLNVKDNRSRNYILQPSIDNIEKYVEEYFLENNLITLKTSDLSQKIKEKHSGIRLNTIGKDIFAVLDYILDSNNDYLVEPLIDVLYERYRVFKNQNRVSIEDLISVYSFGNADLIGSILLFHNESKFKLLNEVLLSTKKKSSYIKEILIKAGINAIQYNNNLQSIDGKEENKDIYSELIKLEQLNDYKEVLSTVNNIRDKMIKAYYLYVINPYSKEIMPIMKRVERSLVNSKNYFKLLVFKYNLSLIERIRYIGASKEKKDFETILKNIPQQFKACCGYFEKLYEGNYDNINTCIQLAKKCEDIYTKKTNTIQFGIPDYDLLKLKTITYNYYYYFKMNNLMLDHFINPKISFEPFLRAIMSTYSPKKERELKDIFGFEPMPLKEYRLNATDFDIIVKHADLKKLKSIILDFKVKELTFSENIEVEKRFVNLCNSTNLFPNKFLNKYLNNFLYILTKCHLDSLKLNIIVDSIFKFLLKESETREKTLPDIFDELVNFLKYFRKEKLAGFNNILSCFLGRDIINYSKKNHLMLDRIYELLAQYSNNEIQEKVSKLIDNIEEINEKIKMIYYLHILFNKNQRFIYMKIVKENLNLVNTDCQFNYVLEKYLEYDIEIEKHFYDTLQIEVDKRKKKPNERSIPDWLVGTIDQLIILFLLNRIKSLKKFNRFIEYSEQLDFLLNPENFDYSKINTDNYMWMNFLRNKKYRKIFQKHRSDIVKNLGKSIENGYATESQKILFYRYFLTDIEISDYL